MTRFNLVRFRDYIVRVQEVAPVKSRIPDIMWQACLSSRKPTFITSSWFGMSMLHTWLSIQELIIRAVTLE